MKDFRKTRRKRIEAWLTAAMFLFGTLTGCGSVSDTHGDVGTPNDGKLKVVTTLFPYYDFTRQIAGDAVDLSMVIPAGMLLICPWWFRRGWTAIPLSRHRQISA